jgi:hypothetical protein
MQHRFQSNSFASASRKPPLISPSLSANPVLIRYSLFPIPYSLPLCYKGRAVERAAKWESAQIQAEPAQAAAQPVASSQAGQSPIAVTEDPSRYCPVCSQRLESRRCKLICSVCGYYMSCADYY